MLILQRELNQIINIGNDVEVCVVAIRGNKVRLGITAPWHVQVDRKELRDQKRREERAARRRAK